MKYIKTFNNHTAYTAFTGTSEFILPNVSFCRQENEVHFNGLEPYHECVEIGGLKWSTMNLGATGITDVGLYFQYGDTQGYTAAQVGSGEGQKYFGTDDYKYQITGNSRWNKYSDTDGLTELEPSDDAATEMWGNKWRMPTVAECIALGAAVNVTYTTDYQGTGISGAILTDKTDSSKTLFIPAAGSASNGVLSQTEIPVFRSKTIYQEGYTTYETVVFTNGNANWNYSGGLSSNRPMGNPIRPIHV